MSYDREERGVPLRLNDLQLHNPNPSSSDPQDDISPRDAHLQAELAGVRALNNTIKTVLSSLQATESNMTHVAETVHSTNRLLDLWIRVLSQADHTQRLLLDSRWQGASADLERVEAETLYAQQQREREQAARIAAERARAEAEVREREARQRAEEERVARAVAATSAPTSSAGTGTRGGRTIRGTTKPVVRSSGYGRITPSETSTTSSTSSGIRRGVGRGSSMTDSTRGAATGTGTASSRGGTGTVSRVRGTSTSTLRKPMGSTR
ncbi:hypothetical protein YB2330_006347 [Saitoella coloradoensis]